MALTPVFSGEIPADPRIKAIINRLAKAGCGAEFMDNARAKNLVNIYTTAFLETYVAGNDTFTGVPTEAYAKESSDLRFQSRGGA